MGQLRILDQDAGDLKVIWDSDKQEEIDAAKEQFDKLIKKGYIPPLRQYGYPKVDAGK